jgi:hypothetical protein
MEVSIMEDTMNNMAEEKLKYEKPVFEKEEELTFPVEIIEQFNGGRFCVQCSGCHGCR